MSPNLKTLIAYLREHPPAQILCGLHHRHDVDEQTSVELVDALECWSTVEQLRADEGDTVLIPADNADFLGAGALVECNGMWTNWQDKKYTGDNVLDALRSARAAREAHVEIEKARKAQ